MSPQPARPRKRILVLCLFALAPFLVVCAGGAPPKTERPPPPKPAPAAAKPKLPEVDKLVDEQKLAEAIKLVDEAIASSRKKGDEDLLAYALIRHSQLRIGLGGWETAVRELKAEAWPKSAVPNAVVELYYAHALTTYVRNYSWEISQREKVDTKGEIDLKLWTKEQIVAEATRAYARIWQHRADIGSWPINLLGAYLELNSYPDNVRGTLRDGLTYFAVEHLADSSLWRADQSNELFKVDFDKLLSGHPSVPLDGDAHPIEKVITLLEDLEAFHAQNGRPEAALEARLERLRRLHNAYSDKKERDALSKALEQRLEKEKQYPWWAMGMALRSEWAGEAGEIVKAHKLAKEGHAAFPKSMGGDICREIVERIEAPDYQLSSMQVDSAGKPSVVVSSKNLGKLYLRAYPYDVRTRIGRAKDYNLLLNGEELKRLAAGKPVAAWTVDLPATPDFRSHRTFSTPPIKKKGYYAIVASARPGFEETNNRLVATQMAISDLVLSTRSENAHLYVTAFDGQSGKVVPDADLELWAFDWQSGHHKVGDARTDKSGQAKLTSSSGRSVFVVGSHGDDVTVDTSMQYLGYRGTESTNTATMIYTDRTVYRPGQKVMWKAVVYSGRDGKYAVQPNRSVTISLRDANYQEVGKKELKTNAYGSAAGVFDLPASGRLLGGWQLTASPNGNQSIRVEEYKRPTFEVSMKEPPAPLRLNQQAKLVGEARYYFGLPVTAGSVRWTVTREEVYPYWWYWYWGRTSGGGTQTVARGTSKLEADGHFDIGFLPAAKPGLDSHVTYHYQVKADVTDEGGETRSANRGYRLGKSAVEATLSTTAGFYDDNKPIEIQLRRTDLDGNPRQGAGSWKLVAIDAPKSAPLPAQLPVAGAREDEDGTPQADSEKKIVTAGDKQRARYEVSYNPAQVLAGWKDGGVKSKGDVAASVAADSKIKLPSLSSGVYRIRYETKDDQGNAADAFVDFIVAGKTPLPLPALLRLERSQVAVGENVRMLVTTGLSAQTLVLETFRAGEVIERKVLDGSAGVIELPMKESDRGGLSFALTAVRDHQPIQMQESVHVPWDNQMLKLSFSTFRDKLRPGGKETFRVTVESAGKNAARLGAGAAELLAYMYDRSLDLFAPHNPPSPMGLFPGRAYGGGSRMTLGSASVQWLAGDNLTHVSSASRPVPDRYTVIDNYGIGGMGIRGYGRGGGGRAMRMADAAAAPGAPPPPPAQAAPAPEAKAEPAKNKRSDNLDGDEERAPARARGEEGRMGKATGTRAQGTDGGDKVRTNFAETAFFEPALITNEKGEASFEFTVPDSVTSWNVWVHAITKDLRSGSIQKETRSVKDLMVRPYMPRFFREADEAELKVVVNNAGTDKLSGNLEFDIIDPETKQSKASLFAAKAESRPFTVDGGKSQNLTFKVKAPRQVGNFAVLAKATAKAGKETFSDGELRPVPVLPSRLHLMQSKFVTLRDTDKRTMKFDDLAKDDDPTRANEQMVVTLDAQLFYTVLRALPYLIDYPYECAEQTLNRFVSTGIVSSLFSQYPQVAKMADQMSKRTTQLQAWDAGDANRKMALEEAPFLFEAKGGLKNGEDASLINVLDQRIARANRDSALDKLKKMQTSMGAWPWFPGGPPSPYITLYVLYGFAKAAEFKVEVPKDMVQRGWSYLAQHYRSEIRAEMRKHDCCWEFLALLNYVASSYPDATWTGDALTMDERKEILAFTYKHWKDTSPYIKGLLALTLKRMGRAADGKKVFDSVMDSAKTEQDKGTFWAQEDRSWLWYNDTIESHAFALRVLMELDPKNQKKDGLVLWLLLNKKLNQWKSTRATAEVIYSLAQYMKADQSLGIREAATVNIGPRQQTYTFEPDKYVGKVQMIVPGPEVDAKSATITVEKKTKGVMFASATWSYATDKMPSEGRGDFFTVNRTYYLRENNGREYVLKPLAEGQTIKVGDEIEVQLAISSKHEAEYVHLRDPRGAGFEPSSVSSRYKWDLGLGYYEEVRDSGANFFFEHLPVGQYTFKYRIRATTGGTFRVGPATLQSMYAPEFSAFSAGHILKIAGN